MDEWKDYDWQGMAKALRHKMHHIRPGDFACIFSAVDTLRHLPYPQAYLDNIRRELIDVLREQSRAPSGDAWVYLTFFGESDRASQMKVGVAKDVRTRMSSIRNGNALAQLWTYAASFSSRGMAFRVERGILNHLSIDRTNGEWVRVHGLSASAAAAMVASLSEVAREISANPEATFRAQEL